MCENPLYFSYTISEGEFLSIYESDFNLGRLDQNANENTDTYDDNPTNEPTPMIKLVLTLSLCIQSDYFFIKPLIPAEA